ncbi:PQQ-binding-like beta-propeller repeat protein [Actinoplanes sp. NBRC 103695]|uniref:outer membrane protein assembly factor BamB family protein n=1 Tax=Actinoplanes sp. NBRC 103695 TaxID=3032202 RepID=UPI0024A0E1C1|nr:PQQ-binding-like beta-propeller repeat protein [Actinoplanes sp. NBRC 103695]GLY97010.1 hypothetical protein Acsp02_42640 [Actinoplanes sp. NBRC 103695]
MLARSLLALVLVGVTGLIGWRVLRPAELHSTGAAPPSAPSAPPGVTGRMSVVPLLVGGRLRVFVSPRQVRADGPVAAKTARTPFWSLRRWPASVTGVVATGTTVVSRWSDGQVIALDGLTGKIRWRLSVPSSGGFTDARTVLWAPPDLYSAGGVALIRAGGQVRALSPSTGATVWSRPCSGAAFATADALACGDMLLSAATGEPVAGATGPFTGVVCGVGCLGARDASGQVWPTSVVPPSGSTVVLGSAGGVSYELTAARHLLARDIATGAVREEFPLAYPHDATDWAPRGWQLADGYLAIDRGPGFTRDQVLLAELP